MPTSSSRAAVSVGVGSPRLVRWFNVLDVVKPSAPARTPSAAMRPIAAISSGRGRLAVRAALAHDEQPHRAVAHLGGEVDVVRTALERVEVLADAAPVPRQTLVQRGTGNVLDALHQLDELRVIRRADGREPDAAVAHHDRGHAVAGRRLQSRVPRRLTVVVRVDVDEARA